MASNPQRGAITDWLLTAVRDVAHDFLVGDVEAPREAGWQSDPSDPAATFIPYIVFTPNAASSPLGGLNDPATDWRLPYTGTSYGVNRRQVEDLADTVRTALSNVNKVPITTADGSTWKILTIQFLSIGGMGYTNAVQPTAFSQTDSFTIMISKSLY